MRRRIGLAPVGLDLDDPPGPVPPDQHLVEQPGSDGDGITGEIAPAQRMTSGRSTRWPR
jgi:hypothetical protein